MTMTNTERRNVDIDLGHRSAAYFRKCSAGAFLGGMRLAHFGGELAVRLKRPPRSLFRAN
eukprot:6888002-Pyramimonas_sp.AAC.1